MNRMNLRRYLALALAVALGVAAAGIGERLASAGEAQAAQPGYQISKLPTPAMDTVKVAGSVEVTNTPTVSAQQAGPWIVGLAGTQTVMVPGPSFMTSGKTYMFTWPTGKSETARVLDIREDGWVQVGGAGQPGTSRWLNPGMALAVEEVR